jgi:FAD/FMN-containing dehydrogenase
MASDPGNLLDATIVLTDGRIVQSAATEEPDLLWAIRGGGGSFGVVASVTLRVFPDYAPKGIFTGRVFYPRIQLDVLIKAVAAYSERCEDPKMALHFYCLTM